MSPLCPPTATPLLPVLPPLPHAHLLDVQAIPDYRGQHALLCSAQCRRITPSALSTTAAVMRGAALLHADLLCAACA